jgi:sarcosine oxidase subunit beta
VRIAVVGAGITGLSVALHLAERGADVTVHERTGVGAEASGVQPGGVRQQWGTRVNCELAREAVGFFNDLPARLEARTTPRLDPCGYLFVAHSPGRLAALERDVALQNDLGVPSEVLGPAAIAELVPGIETEHVAGAAFCGEDGYFDQPQAVVEAFAHACERRGARIERATVTALAADGDGWVLERHEGAVTVDAVVLATGYDTPALVEGLGADVPIAKEARYLLYSEPIRERLVEPLVVSSELRFAAKHLQNGRVLASDLSATGDPDENAPAWRASVKDTAHQLLPILEYVTYPIVVEGFYDITPDHQPVIGPVPGHDGLWVAAGFSGHGFMMAPAVGRIVADALIDARHDPALASFSLGRFARGLLTPELQIV